MPMGSGSKSIGAGYKRDVGDDLERIAARWNDHTIAEAVRLTNKSNSI